MPCCVSQPKVFLFVFCVIYTFSPPAFLFGEEEPSVNFFDEISKLTEKSGILASEDIRKLVKLVDFLEASEADVPQFNRAQLDILTKVSHDKTQLDSLLHNLESLADWNYSNEIGKVDRKGLQNAWLSFKDFEKCYSEALPKYSQSQDRLNTEYYLSMMKSMIRLLTGEGGCASLMDVWEQVEDVARGPYPAWHAVYRELKEKLNTNVDPFGRYKYLPNYEEAQFVENFRQTQYLLRSLSADHTEDF